MKIAGLPVIEVDESEEITVAVRADDLPFPEPSEVGATIFLLGCELDGRFIQCELVRQLLADG